MSADIYPDAPGHKGPSETGIDAANDMKEHCGRLQRIARDAIYERGWEGFTADELAEHLGLDRWTIQPRTSELRRKHLISDSKRRRRNSTGKNAIVWVAPEYAPIDEQKAA